MSYMEKLDELEREWTIGYGLDGGGYAFEKAESIGGIEPLLMWDDPDWGYILGETPEGLDRGDTSVLYVAPGPASSRDDWPELLEDDDGDSLWELACNGWLAETDRECDWCGPGTDATDEEKASCKHCDGDGYVVSPGGGWAAYKAVYRLTWHSSLHGFSLELDVADVYACNAQGDVSEAVKSAVSRERFRLDGLNPADIIAELRETGAWDDFEDEDENLERLIFIAAGELMADINVRLES